METGKTEYDRMLTLSTGNEGQQIEGVFSVQRVTFSNEETGYADVHLTPADQNTPAGITAVGQFGRPRVGEGVRVISVSVEKGLLQAIDKLAKRKKENRFLLNPIPCFPSLFRLQPCCIDN